MRENDPSIEPITSGDVPGSGGGSSDAGPGPVREPAAKLLGGRFELREAIGHGAFAVTYRGHDHRLDRAVAIKVVRIPDPADLASIQRSEREARVAASVAHGNVVDVYDFGQHGDLLYLVMRHVEGEDLKHLIAREGPLTPARAVAITLQILAGLTAIHEAGIIHRDIKPENVMIDRDGTARVTDFGIARGAEDVGLTTAGTTVGTASYMAPEQAQAGALTEASDLYSVAVVLYEMLTARLPFEAPTIFALLLAHIQTPPVPPSARAPSLHIPRALDAVVMRALAKQPADRFEDAPAMASALAVAGGSIAADGQTTRHLAAIDPDSERTIAHPSLPVAKPRSRAIVPGAAPPPPLATRRRRWFLPLLLVSLLLVGGGMGGAAILRTLRADDDSPGNDRRMIVVELDPSPTPTLVPADAPEPAPTATRRPTETPQPEPTDTPVPQPTDTPEPPPTATLPATDTPVPPPTTTPAPTATVASEPRTTTVDFVASDWRGAYFQETGNLQPWSALYAQSTGYGEGSLRFTIDGEPVSDAFVLTVEGMTSENWTELPIAILVNGERVYTGDSPFPTWNGVEGEQAWATIRVELPATALKRGTNTVTFENAIDEGDFSRPPYILLAAGSVSIEIR